jgi:hypothetical protein
VRAIQGGGRDERDWIGRDRLEDGLPLAFGVEVEPQFPHVPAADPDLASGRFSVRVGDEEVPPGAFGGRLVRTLVRILLTRRGEMAPKDVLVDALWGERRRRIRCGTSRS